MISLDHGVFRLLACQRRFPEAFRNLCRSWLGRPFPGRSKHKVLLVQADMWLGSPQFYPFYYFGKRFAELGFSFRCVPFPGYDSSSALVQNADAIFLQAPYEVPSAELRGALAGFRRLNPAAPISFFDFAAPADVRFAYDVAPWTSCYLKKSLLRDRSQYLDHFQGHTNLEDYYCARFGLESATPHWEIEPAIVDRLALSPAFGTSIDLLPRFDQLKSPPITNRVIDVNARIATKGAPWYASMRGEALDAAKRLAGRWNVAWAGRIPIKRYMAELEQSKLCFSPFGYGELCWRDFEAVLAGSVLIKPDMSHLDCLANIFQPNVTYVPVRWDLADIEDVVEALLADPVRQRQIATAALDTIRRYLFGDTFENLAKQLVELAPQG